MSSSPAVRTGTRSGVVIALPADERVAVATYLAEAGHEGLSVTTPEELKRLLDEGTSVRLAILDAENAFDDTLEMYSLLHDDGRNVPALIVIPPRALDRMRLAGRARGNEEYLTRPYSPESLRWRVEAMLIRAQTVATDANTLLEPPGAVSIVPDSPAANGNLVVIFNPKGGVGKTTIAVNLAAALQLRKEQRVLLVDCDIVTGHIASSVGLDEFETVVDAWADAEQAGRLDTLSSLASPLSSGVNVIVMATSPIHTEALAPRRVAESIHAARASYDWIIVDMHPDSGPLNQAIFAMADRVIVPVTPDVPTLRAAIQFRRVADELSFKDRLTLVVNRSDAGISVSDVERTVGMPSLAEVRSAGMLFVRAANEGASAVERFPKEKVIGDIDALADAMIAGHRLAPRSGWGRLLARVAAAAREGRRLMTARAGSA